VIATGGIVGNCGQLTSLHGTAGAARWSPDGRHIAFEFRPKEHSEIYLLEVGGGVPRLLPTLSGADNGGPSWSRDGKWIYFYSDRGSGPFQLWKIQLSGGSPVQVTKKGGVFGTESDDGRFLYYSKFETPGIWKMPLNGGEEFHILDQPAGESWSNWSLARNGIYFFGSNTGPNPASIFLTSHQARRSCSLPRTRHLWDLPYLLTANQSSSFKTSKREGNTAGTNGQTLESCW
jgi:Tol biopolymer transport system component